MQEEKQTDFGKILFTWDVPEYDKHERTKNWYVYSIIFAAALILFSIFTGNFLFAVIIIMATFIYFLRENNEPDIVKFSITEEGVVIGSKFYDYDEMKDFSVVYKPRYHVKNLYFEFKNVLRHRLSVPLNNNNPLPIRENLLKYLPEDLERTDQPLSEVLSKMFKL